MYLFANSLFRNRTAGLLVSILYLWAPYRFLTILVGAAMGTAFVFVFLPLLLLGIWKIGSDKEPNNGIVLSALSLAGIILSHLMTLFSIIPFVFIFSFWILCQEKKRVLWHFLQKVAKALIIGIGISSFYLLPAIFYRSLTQVSTGYFKDLYKQNFPNLGQLIYSKWGYGIPHENIKEEVFSLQVGIAQWLSFAGIIFVIAILFFGKKFQLIRKIKNILLRKTGKNHQNLIIVLAAGFTLNIFFMLDLSRPIWDGVSKLVILDYPTMFMLPAVFVGSILGGALFLSAREPFRTFILFGLVLTAIYTNRNHLRVNMYTYFPVSLYVESETTTNSFHEYLPAKADLKSLYEEGVPLIIPKNLEVSDFNQNTKQMSLSVYTPEETDIVLKHFSFPGINLYVDRERKNFTSDKIGRIKFTATEGEYKILVKFEDTPLIKTGKAITLLSLFLVFYIWRRSYA